MTAHPAHGSNEKMYERPITEIVELVDRQVAKISAEVANEPTQARPGSLEKIAILIVRYREGIPLWIKGDCDVRVA